MRPESLVLYPGLSKGLHSVDTSLHLENWLQIHSRPPFHPRQMNAKRKMKGEDVPISRSKVVEQITTVVLKYLEQVSYKPV